jgi:hypothetical protein
LKSGSLNLLEPSGPVKACDGVALPVTRCIITQKEAFLNEGKNIYGPIVRNQLDFLDVFPLNMYNDTHSYEKQTLRSQNTTTRRLQSIQIPLADLAGGMQEVKFRIAGVCPKCNYCEDEYVKKQS